MRTRNVYISIYQYIVREYFVDWCPFQFIVCAFVQFRKCSQATLPQHWCERRRKINFLIKIMRKKIIIITSIIFIGTLIVWRNVLLRDLFIYYIVWNAVDASLALYKISLARTVPHRRLSWPIMEWNWMELIHGRHVRWMEYFHCDPIIGWVLRYMNLNICIWKFGQVLDVQLSMVHNVICTHSTRRKNSENSASLSFPDSRKQQIFQVRNSTLLMSLGRRNHLIEWILISLHSRSDDFHVVRVRMSSSSVVTVEFNIFSHFSYFVVAAFLAGTSFTFNAHLMNTSSRSLQTETMNSERPNETELIISTSAVSLRVLLNVLDTNLNYASLWYDACDVYEYAVRDLSFICGKYRHALNFVRVCGSNQCAGKSNSAFELSIN